MIRYDRYPGGKHFAVTFSYDDGNIADRRLVALFNKYGLKATFHLIPSRFGGDTVISSDEVKTLYSGHEISGHTYSHPHLVGMPISAQLEEITRCRAELEALSGTLVRGMSLPYGGKNAATVTAMKAAGIAYSRNAGATGGLSVPADFLDWNPTCHHSAASKIIENFKNAWINQSWNYGGLIDIWGHSFEFDRADNWQLAEEMCASLSGLSDVWYATNIEICDYITAQRTLILSQDQKTIFNPSAISVWVSSDGSAIEIKSGESVRL